MTLDSTSAAYGLVQVVFAKAIRRKAAAICIPMAVARVVRFNGSCHTERARMEP
jgi:hypothetical protein